MPKTSQAIIDARSPRAQVLAKYPSAREEPMGFHVHIMAGVSDTHGTRDKLLGSGSDRRAAWTSAAATITED